MRAPLPARCPRPTARDTGPPKIRTNLKKQAEPESTAPASLAVPGPGAGLLFSHPQITAGCQHEGVSSRVSQAEFEALASEALEQLPEDIAVHMSNVVVLVEDSPPAEILDKGAWDRDALLGFYEGIPLTSRNRAYSGVLPDRITLYRRNLEAAARNSEHLRRLVQETVIHEIAHHFGIGEDRLEELGWS